MSISLTNVVSVWEFNEANAADNGVDAVGSNVLVQTNAPGVTTGKTGGARSFTAASLQRFAVADNASVSMAGTDMSISVWVKFTTIGLFPCILSKANAGGGAMEYELRYNSVSNRFEFLISNDGVAIVSVAADAFGAATTGVWYHLTAEYTSSSGALRLYVNATTVNGASGGLGILDSTNPLTVGSRDSGGIPLDGVLDQLVIRKRVTTSGERAALYNSGAGLPFTLWRGSRQRNQLITGISLSL